MKQFVKIKNIINDITYSLKYSEKKKIFKKNKSINITENITENKIDSKSSKTKINSLQMINPNNELFYKKIIKKKKRIKIKKKIKKGNYELTHIEPQGNIIALNPKEINENIFNKKNKIMEYSEQELNHLEYKIALKHDKRTYCQFYLSLLRTQHNLIFTFYTNDYNSKIIKINLFFLSLLINLTVNALFFNDKTMHHIYEIKGSFDLEYEIPKIIYSSLVSSILNSLLKILALSNDNIIIFKQQKSNDEIQQKKEKLESKLRIKFILYFIASYIILFFCGYYLSMFCAIYKNTQLYLIKDTLSSILLSLIYPFGVYLLPGLFRIPAIFTPNKDREYIYKFSQFLLLF